jgi:hypothetical protein
MIKFKDILNDAPLGTYTTIGKFEKGASYKDPRDRAALSHPVTIQKVKDMLKNTSVDFDFYFVNKPGLRKFSETGKVPYEFIVKPYPNGLGIDPNQIEINKNNITVFFVGNTAADKIPMTAWTIIHRVGHVMNRTPQFQDYTKWLDNEFDELLSVSYGKQKPSRFSQDTNDYKKSRTYDLAKGRLFNHIGTMRSAREGKLHRRYYEFYYELFVQYLKDGKITFNPLTKNLLVGFGPYGSKTIANTQNLAEAQEKLDMIANTIPYLVEDVLNANVGDIFVM